MIFFRHHQVHLAQLKLIAQKRLNLPINDVSDNKPVIPKDKVPTEGKQDKTTDTQSASTTDTDKTALASLPATVAHQDELTLVVIGGSAIILIGVAIKYIFT